MTDTAWSDLSSPSGGVTETAVLDVLSQVVDPVLKQDIVKLDHVHHLAIDQGVVRFTLDVATPLDTVRDQYKTAAKIAVQQLPGVKDVIITLRSKKPKTVLSQKDNGLQNVARIIAVSSCKGGVGKSTVAVNLAFALSLSGAKVGIFDADIYGPSLPTMVDVNHHLVVENDKIQPIQYADVKLMSFGFTQTEEEKSKAAIIRGPLVSQLINQLLTQTNWGTLDYLILDLPPGTGDVQLTLSQIIPITAAVMVTTPQKISFVDVVKGIQMFDSLNIPTIAVVENMSYFQPKDTDIRYEVFGKGALYSLINEFGFENTYQMPIEPEVSASGDSGTPLVIRCPNTVSANTMMALADSIGREVTRLEHGKIRVPDVHYDERDGIVIRWPDQKVMILPKALRLACRCARCVDELTGRQIIQEEAVSDHIAPIQLSPIGNYAVGVEWNDGHSSLYPYTKLEPEREGGG